MSDETSQLLIRVSLLGAQAAKAQIVETGAAVSAFGDEAEATGDKTAFAAEKSFLFGESMYSLRRYVFYALTAVGATGAAVLKMGYDFDEAKTKSVGALTSLVGGTTQAATEVNKLVNLTYASGLGLSTLTTATQQMLTFGFSVKQTNQYMSAFANYAGKMGTGSSGISSLATLFNEVKAQTYMSSKQIKELEAMGIPGPGAGGFLQAFNLNAAQQMLLAQGKLIVPASSALPDLSSWLSGYAAKQPTTLTQTWGKLHALLSSITGTIGQPIFRSLGSGSGGLDSLLTKVADAGKTGGTTGMLKALDPSGTLLNAWASLKMVITQVAAAAKGLWTVAGPLIGGLAALAAGVLALTGHSTALRLAFDGLIAVYIMSRTYLLLNLAAVTALKTVTLTFAAATLLVKQAQYAAATATAVWGAVTDSQIIQLTLLRGVVVLSTAATWMLTAAQATFTAGAWLLDAAMTPWLIIPALLIGIGVGFYELYTRVGWFRTGVTDVWRSVVTLWNEFTKGGPIVAAALILAFGPLGLALEALLLIIKYHNEIESWGSKVAGDIGYTGPGKSAGTMTLPEKTLHTLKKADSKDTSSSNLSSAMDRLGDKIIAGLSGNTEFNLNMDGRTIAKGLMPHRAILANTVAQAKLEAQGRK